MPHKAISAGGLAAAAGAGGRGSALSAGTPCSSAATSVAAHDTPRSSNVDGHDAAEPSGAALASEGLAGALAATALAAADAAAADCSDLAIVPAAGPDSVAEARQQQQRAADGGPPGDAFDIWPDTEEVLQQMVAWLAGLDTGVCQGRAASEPAAARSRSYLSVHKVAALLAGEPPSLAWRPLKTSRWSSGARL